MKKNMVGRQISTMVFLVLLIAVCIAAGVFLRYQRNMGDAITIQGIWDQVTGSAEPEAITPSAKRAVPADGVVFFRGVGGEDGVARLVPMLVESSIAARFFASASEVQAAPGAVEALTAAGYDVGIAYDAYPGTEKDDILSELSQQANLLSRATGRTVSTLLTVIEPDQALLEAAGALGIDRVYVEGDEIAFTRMTDEQAASQYHADRKQQSVVISLRGMDQLPKEELERALLNIAADPADLTAVAQQKLNQTQAAQIGPISRIYTTEPAVGYTFSGLSTGRDEFPAVLSALRQIGGKALFFVTLDEVLNCQSDIQQLLSDGHDLGMLVTPAQHSSAAGQLEELLSIEKAIRNTYGYQKPLPVRQSYGAVSAVLSEAAASGGYTLLSSMRNAVPSEESRETDAAVVLEAVMPAAQGALQKGEIVHFQMGLFQRSDTILSELVTLMSRERSVYAPRSPLDILSNTEYTYTYPVPQENMLSQVRDAIAPGKMGGHVTFEDIQARYIGISWVNSTRFLPGFTSAQVRQMDRKGLVDNEKNMVFLTFDDWGTDATIMSLLDVLRRHNAKATFFVRTEHVSNNPNLLRTIALEGHTVASHTHRHVPMSIDISGKGTRFEELSDEELEAFREDIVLSYQTLQSIIGDVEVDGVPALTRLFRPPTLAVGRNSMEVLLDCGYTYCVSGSYTSQDYKAESAQRLSDQLYRNTRSGAVLIMHMSDNSVHTAEALDLYLTNIENKNLDFSFVGLSEVLK